jgi:hypothetical protein
MSDGTQEQRFQITFAREKRSDSEPYGEKSIGTIACQCADWHRGLK